MSKERISASVEPEVAEFLRGDDVNASGLINQLVKNHMDTGGGRKAMLQLRREQLQSEINEARNTVAAKQDSLETVEAELDELTDDTDEVVAEASDALADAPADPENPAVKNWADKAELPPAEFLSRLEAYEARADTST